MSQITKLERLRRDAREIVDAGIRAADPEEAVKRFFGVSGEDLLAGPDLRLSLSDFDRVLVVGAGKASASMVKAVEDLLGDRIDAGVICVKHGHGLPLQRIKIVEAAHPLPNQAGEEAARKIVGLLESAGERDLVVSCISGGGSALLPAPTPPVTLSQKEEITRKLLASSADIHEINAVRKHLSFTKGGNLMRAAYPAFVINLMLSDVIGDDPGTVASGPFAPDQSSFHDALEVLGRYGLLATAAPEIVNRLREGAEGRIPENPKEGEYIFNRVLHGVVGSNIISLCAGAQKARELGYGTLILSSSIAGDTVQAALFHAALAEEIHSTGNPVRPPACLLSGGETTVEVRGEGLGGRNQHFALALVQKASKLPNTLFLSAGTDGTDGPTDAAGAIVDTRTMKRAISMGIDYKLFLQNNDSYRFFRKLGDLIVTGPTRTNVMDMRLVLVGG
jgi:hydroxypyruvate reductase